MTTDPDDPQLQSDAPVATADGHPHPPSPDLPEYIQRRNSLVFLFSMSLSYLVAPVFYVGILHAAIIKSLGSKDAVANLPESLYTATLLVPVLMAWFWPSTRYLRPMLVSSYLLKGVAGLVTAALFLLAPGTWLVLGLILHAAIIGATNGVTNMCLWELIGRGMTTARRGWTLGITFGLGPIFAVVGSFASQLVLSGNFLNVIHVNPVPKPWSYVILFGFTGPAMIVSALCVFLAHLPCASDEPTASVAGVIRGLREYFRHRLILIAACGFLLTLAGGNMILPNLGLYARDMMHEAAEKYSGLQLAIRFGSKSLVGFSLAWLLARSNPKLPALATTLISLAGVCWALAVPGKWYLLSFAMVGAGELFYIYYLNYIVGCSAPHRVRENIAYTNVIMVSVSFVPWVYGRISDRFGLTSSFILAGGILVVATLIVWLFLPGRPALVTVGSEAAAP